MKLTPLQAAVLRAIPSGTSVLGFSLQFIAASAKANPSKVKAAVGSLYAKHLVGVLDIAARDCPLYTLTPAGRAEKARMK